jgi:hypothetical protein
MLILQSSGVNAFGSFGIPTRRGVSAGEDALLSLQADRHS